MKKILKYKNKLVLDRYSKRLNIRNIIAYDDHNDDVDHLSARWQCLLIGA